MRAPSVLGGVARLAAWVAGLAAPTMVLATGTGTFVNFETPHVSPLAMTPDGTRLLAVNTADGRLEVFNITTGIPVRAGSVPVGIDPVTVRARTSTEAWVVNHISDSVSVVNLTTMAVTATLRAVDPTVTTDVLSKKYLDEPWDVVFAGTPQKAYVTFGVSKIVAVWDPANLGAAPTLIPITGEQPKAMAVSPDGGTVYVAIFESGNNTTVLGGGAMGGNIGFPPLAVSNASGPYGGANPPPNVGTLFTPSVAVAGPPPVALIVRKNAANEWMDDNNHNWTSFVRGPNAPALSGRVPGWDLWDNDVAMIDTSNNAVTYVNGLMNLCMGIAVNPATGGVAVIGTEATNEVRFEPNITGTFVRVKMALVNPASPGTPSVVDLNPHLGSYSQSTIPQTERDKSIGDPRGVVFTGSGTAFVSGMGSNNVVVVDAAGTRTPADNVIGVGKGPTGLALDEARSRLYVMNKFDGSISTVDTTTRAVVKTTPFFDPTPAVIKVGRTHLYDTHKNSGLGQIACASCHIDGKLDRLAWDLGNPAGSSVAVTLANRNLGQGLFGLEPGTTGTPFRPYHPMKGPMTTQTLQDIVGHEPHHWRGDKLGLEEFNAAFIGLQGDDTSLTATEMQEFEDFLATIALPPNPYRNFDNTLPTSLPLPGHYTTGRFAAAGAPLPVGNAQDGLAAYRSQTTRLDGNGFSCVTCHTLPTGQGTDMRQSGPFTVGYSQIAPDPVTGARHLQLVSVDGLSNVTMKTPQLRIEYKKTGFNGMQTRNTAGFGVLHDGSVDSIERFVAEPVFVVTGDQMIADLTAFMLAFSGSDLPQGSANSPLEPPGPASKDAPASLGVQTTAAATADATLINSMVTLASAPNARVSVIAKGLVGGVQRGYRYDGAGTWTSDRAAEAQLPTASLIALAGASSPITFTVVSAGLQTRLGIDRDEDGWLDRDEASVCSDTADATVHPGNALCLDVDGNLAIEVQDIFAYLNAWFAGTADFNRDGVTQVQDIFDYLNAWFAGC
ncbi:MAG TPA: GC-type dockerin domain-anchored protein [Phycisphaerales bacterium]|nr:GC-type dockerin domain-anchored protein [Phycisphaerales bacterium]